MDDLEQIITCPNCKGKGWRIGHSTTGIQECPVCDTRGMLVIDSEKTLSRKPQPAPTRT